MCQSHELGLGDLLVVFGSIAILALSLIVAPILYTGMSRESDLGRAPTNVTTLGAPRKTTLVAEAMLWLGQARSLRYIATCIGVALILSTIRTRGSTPWMMRCCGTTLLISSILLFFHIFGIISMMF